MSLPLLRRLLLYFFSVFFSVFGFTGLIAPAMLATKLDLTPLNNAGLGELRALYGGGFAAIGLTILAVLRYRSASQGLFLAIGILITGIVAGRLLSMLLDHDVSAAGFNAIGEIILAAACFFECRQGYTTR